MKSFYRFAFAVLFIAAFAGIVRAERQPGERMIDDFSYADDAAAQAAWRPMAGSPKVEVVRMDGRMALRLRCAFADGKISRGSWDKPVKLDLSAGRGIEFDVLCRDSRPVSYFSIYFQSGEGWYSGMFFANSTNGWETVTIDKAEMKAEGKPAGWDKIKTIRISAWRSQNVDTEFFVSALWQTPPAPVAGSREAAEESIRQIGEIAAFKIYQEATNQITLARHADARLNEALAATAALRETALKLVDEQKFAEASAQARAAREQLVKAYCLAQEPEPGEFRAFWCHSAFGVQGMDWDEGIRRLSENGFNAIVVNMLAGGVAYYPSKVLPVAPAVAQRGDQIKLCLAACRKYGVQLHAWKLDWNLSTAAPKEFVNQMRGEARLQTGADGKEELWLCPSQPANQQLEIDAMLEVVRNYDVDGIHFDYIRYPDAEHCFCAGCKERFQHDAGVTIKQWPADVLAGGPFRQQWLDWRRGNITKVVKAVSEQARAIKPKMKLSAAVFKYWNTDRDEVGQDWKVWCDHGYLDFVCPMDYTENKSRFENMVAQQVVWAGKVPCYPGLGVSASSSRFGADRAIEEILVTRRYRTHGFIIFNYGVKESEELLPLLGMGISKKTETSNAER